MNKQREIWLDWLRVTACFLVMATHSCEPFYLGGEGSLILTKSDALWVSFLNVLPRACVALFVVASSYLQFPLHYSTGEFFKRRAKRILIPFLVWSVVYALVWGEPVQNFKDLLLNFNYAAGHLWFVYMLIGLYLIMPLLSPWAEKVGKRELQVYLGIWLFTTLIPLIRQWVGGPAPVIYGPSGIPNAAKLVEYLDDAVYDFPLPADPNPQVNPASTDVGDVSHCVPTIMPCIGIGCPGTMLHTAEFREATMTEAGDRAMKWGAQAMALTALQVMADPDLMRRIRDEFAMNPDLRD